MKRRTRTTTHRSSRKAGNARLTWKFNVFVGVCGLLLFASIFFAGRNHFASVNLGFKNAQLRKDIEGLQSEKRRLTLSMEVALSPAEIKKAAGKLGFTTMTARNIDGVSPVQDVARLGRPGNGKQDSPQMVASLNTPGAAKKVVKTAYVAPASDVQRARN